MKETGLFWGGGGAKPASPCCYLSVLSQELDIILIESLDLLHQVALGLFPDNVLVVDLGTQILCQQHEGFPLGRESGEALRGGKGGIDGTQAGRYDSSGRQAVPFKNLETSQRPPPLSMVYFKAGEE